MERRVSVHLPGGDDGGVAGQPARIVPSRVQPGLDAPLDIGQEVVPHHQHPAGVWIPQCTEHRGKKGGVWLAGPQLLRNKQPGDEAVQGGCLEAAALGAGHAVGDNGQGAAGGQGAAQRLSPRQEVGALPQVVQVGPVEGRGISRPAQGPQQGGKPLYHQPLPAHLTPVQPVPERPVDG